MFYSLATFHLLLNILFILEFLLFIPEGYLDNYTNGFIDNNACEMYQRILDTLRIQTSYVKLTDVWLMTCRTNTFLMFIIKHRQISSEYSTSIYCYIQTKIINEFTQNHPSVSCSWRTKQRSRWFKLIFLRTDGEIYKSKSLYKGV